MNAFDFAYNTYADRINRNCSRSWIRQAYNECVKLWDATAAWAKNYIFDPTAKLVDRIKRAVPKLRPLSSCRALAKNITWEVEPIKGNVHYLVYFYKKSGELLYAKNGKAHDVANRIKHELCDEYAKYGAYSAKVVRVDYCGDDTTAATLEMAYRVELLYKNNPANWIPNDRWTTDVFNLREYDEFAKNFFKKMQKRA